MSLTSAPASPPKASPTFDAHVPAVFAGGRWHTADEIAAAAGRWRRAMRRAVDGGALFIAAAPPTTPDGVAQIVAASTVPVPTILLEPGPAGWARIGRLPPRTTLVLPPSSPQLATVAGTFACEVTTLPDDPAVEPSPGSLLTSPGIVIFTSGSTGAPKPVFRPTVALARGAAARLSALGVEPGTGIVSGASLSHGRGVTLVVSAMLLGGPLGFIGPLNHRAALAALAMPAFGCWWATAHFADVLGRCDLRGPATAPPTCLISNRLPRQVFDRFLDRYGVPIRQTYSSSETGCLTVDAASAADVRPETVGRPVAGVDIRIGDSPHAPLGPGEIGRIWINSPWTMAGYGFPPDCERPGLVDGWWPMRDVGAFDERGYVTLAGRLDDCIRTREGQLVNLASVACELEGLPGVSAAVVVPLDATAGVSFGAVIETERGLAGVRQAIGDALPAWARPRRLALVAALPRLSNGKPDRLACRAQLGAHGDS